MSSPRSTTEEGPLTRPRINPSPTPGHGRGELRQRIRSITIRACVLLLILFVGAIVNISVSWFFSYSHQQTLLTALFVVSPPPTSRTLRRLYSLDLLRLVESEQRCASWFEQFEDPSGMLVFSEFACGWPLKSLRGRITWDASSSGSAQLIGMLPLSGSITSSNGPALPAIPVWPGFAINTVFYATILWLLVAALLKVRHRRRMKRGHCINCNYDLRGAPAPGSTDSGSGGGCPECGWNREEEAV